MPPEECRGESPTLGSGVVTAGPSDAEIVEQVLDGDVEAFRVLLDRYYAACGRYAYRLLGHREDAEDALQETFLRVYRSLGGYDERNSFRAWLYRVLVNQCRSLGRRRSRRQRDVSCEDRDAHGRVVPSAEGAVDLRDTLHHALQRIELPSREAVLLKYGEGFEYEEIARMTGASVSALKMRVKRAREILRDDLDRESDE